MFSFMTQASTPKGFPSPAQDYKEKLLDLNTLLVKNPPATFFVRCKGNSMTKAGIFNNDILIVDKSVKPRSNNIVVAFLDGEFMVRRLYLQGNRVTLVAESFSRTGDSAEEEVSGDLRDFIIWGVVVHVLHDPNNCYAG